MNARSFVADAAVVAIVGLLVVGAASVGIGFGVASAADDWPDEEGDATEVGPGTYEGAIDSSDDTDYMRVPVGQGDTVTATLEKAQGDGVVATIYWPGGATALEGEAETELTEKATVDEAGYFYVELRSESDEGFSEDWSLTLDRNEDVDAWPNHEEDATEVGTGTHSGAISSWDDADYMRMPVQQGDTVTATLEKAQGEDVIGTVYWPGGATALEGEAETELAEKATVDENGYFYAELQSESVELDPEDWTVTLQRTEDVDEWPNHEEDATEVAEGEHSGAISSWDDTDYMRMPIQGGKTATVTLEKAQGEGVIGTVYWPGGATALEGEAETRLSERLTAEETGYVYVELQSESVEFDPESWSVTFDTTTTEDRWPDSENDAAEVDEGDHSGSISSWDDADFMRMPIQEGDTATVALEKAQGEDLFGTVYWPGGAASLEDESATELTRKLTADDNGYVYVQLETDADEGFPKQWSVDLASTDAVDEWPNDEEDAPEVEPGTYEGAIDSPDDNDAVRTMVQSGETYTVELRKAAGRALSASVVWPGGAAALSGTGETTLRETITAEENGYVDVLVESESVETGSEAWEIAITEGATETTTTPTETTTTETETTTTETTTTEITTTETTVTTQTTAVVTETPTTTPDLPETETTTSDLLETDTPTTESAEGAGAVEETTREEAPIEDEESGTVTADENGASQPGFTLIAALVALVLALAVARRSE